MKTAYTNWTQSETKFL